MQVNSVVKLRIALMDKTLYRYRPINDLTIEGLERSEFYFISPEDFNDPFDCKNIFTFDSADDNDFRKFFQGQLRYKFPSLSPREVNEKVESIIKSGSYRTKEAQAAQLRIWRDILDEESNKLGLVCFSKNPNDILMWSHYSAKHSGICLKFDQDILESRFFCARVHYSQKYPTFKEFVARLNRSGLKSVYQIFLLTKSTHWRYEKEYRLIEDPSRRTDVRGERKYTYPEEALVGIIWGCQTSDKNKEKIREALKNRTHPITYYRAEKSESSYSVRIVEA